MNMFRLVKTYAACGVLLSSVMPLIAGDETDFTQTFYNEKGEVTNFVCRSLGVSWKYDQLGNRVCSMKPSITNFYTVNALNQYTTISNSFGASVNLQYDEDGNLTKDHRFNYAWDAENRLASIWPAIFLNGGIIIKNSYDHLHRRVKKKVEKLVDFDSSQPSSPTNGRLVNIFTSIFIYDQNRIILEDCAHSNGTHSITHYVWGKDLSGSLDEAGGVGGLLAVQSEHGVFYPHYDAHGNIIEYVDSSGGVVAQYRYDPFGETINSARSLKDSFRFRFSTKYHDDETFLYDYGHRFYDPWLGRWISRDPIHESDSPNIYVFVHNNPVNKVDVDGRSAYPWGTNPAQQANTHFQELKSSLAQELKKMCPFEKEKKWNPPHLQNTEFCCKRKKCLGEATEFANVYVDAIKKVWMAERKNYGNVQGGMPGNFRAGVGDSMGKGENASDWTTGDGLICGGWTELGMNVFESTLSKASKCWRADSGEDYNNSILNMRNPPVPSHIYLQMHSPDATRKLDPWPSGGWNY